MDNKSCNLLLQEHCKKLFLLMDSFWDEIKGFNFDFKWLFKGRNHLEKLERKKWTLSKNAEIKKLTLARSGWPAVLEFLENFRNFFKCQKGSLNSLFFFEFLEFSLNFVAECAAEYFMLGCSSEICFVNFCTPMQSD